MDFKLSEEQQMLQDTAARLVRDAYPFEQREKTSQHRRRRRQPRRATGQWK